MAIESVPYVDPTRLGLGEQSDGKAWLPINTQDFTGFTAGDLVYRYTAEIYAGDDSWGDGSSPVAVTSRVMAPWRVRNALRSVPQAFAAVTAALQEQAAAELGGVYVADDPPAWLFDPMETAPEPEAGEGE